ncbi:hypothetical protein EV424DRAFT_1546541 [Suillus variegatus]|nr:hypothetical protein EV424DRAFT_1546541 [Suillus variegatus]
MSQDSPSPTKQLQECSYAINVLPNHAEPSPAAEMSLFRLPKALAYNTTPYLVPDSEQRTTWVYWHEATYPEIVWSMADDCDLYLYRELSQSDIFDPCSMSAKVIKVENVSYSGENGSNQIVSSVAPALV